MGRGGRGGKGKVKTDSFRDSHNGVFRCCVRASTYDTHLRVHGSGVDDCSSLGDSSFFPIFQLLISISPIKNSK
jgi:hypothetical protein